MFAFLFLYIATCPRTIYHLHISVHPHTHTHTPMLHLRCALKHVHRRRRKHTPAPPCKKENDIFFAKLHHFRNRMSCESSRARKRTRLSKTKSTAVTMPSANATLKIHDLCVPLRPPAGITAMAQTGLHIQPSRLAVSRSDATLSLYVPPTCGGACVEVSRLQLDGVHVAVTGLRFSKSGLRLFVSRLDGCVLVVRVQNGHALSVVERIGGGDAPVWGMDICEGSGRVALACDDARVRFVKGGREDGDGEEDEDGGGGDVLMSKKGGGRCLCVTWRHDGRFVASGDENGCVRVMNGIGEIVGIGKIECGNKGVKIWSISYSESGDVILCGDSRGVVTIWCAETMTLIEEIVMQGVRGGLWSCGRIGGCELESIGFGSAGGDVAIVRREKDGRKWGFIRGRHLHTHDVRAIVGVRGGVLTGGMDGCIGVLKVEDVVNGFGGRLLRNVGGVVETCDVKFVAWGRAVVGNWGGGIDVWGIDGGKGSVCLKLRVTLDKVFKGNVRAFAISQDLKMLAVSAEDEFRMYQVWNGVGNFDRSDGFGSVSRLRVGERGVELMKGCVDMEFGDCGVLFCVPKCRRHVVVFEGGDVGLWRVGACGVARVVCGAGLIVVCDFEGAVHFARVKSGASVADVCAGEWSKVDGLGGGGGLVSAVGISKCGMRIVVCVTGARVYVCDLKGGGVECVDVKLEGVVDCVSFSDDGTGLLMSGGDFCVVAEIGERKEGGGHRGKRKREGAVYWLPYKRGVAASCVLARGEIVVVRRNWKHGITTLGNAIPKRKFVS